MKQRPILFSAPMVRALLDGSKTQTRRIMKPQPEPVPHRPGDYQWPCNAFQSMVSVSDTRAPGAHGMAGDACPHGGHRDRLWVRETWRSTGDGGRADYLPPRDMQPHKVWYDADGAAPASKCTGKTRTSIHMPRWASRILLEIVSVRVERLNDCSAADARAEGLISYEHFWRDSEYPLPDIAYEPFKGSPTRYSDPVQAYRALWESINGAGSWDANPWVWVIEFKRVMP